MHDLSRSLAGRPAAPVRIAHLGLGAFHRAHQAWYTDVVDTTHEWGIAAFTGRSATAAEELTAQGGVYTLLERSEAGDRPTVVSSISLAHDGRDLELLSDTIAAETTALVTLTITEAGYVPQQGGALDRLVAALDRRRTASAAPIALVPCDNMPGNGAVLRAALLDLAGRRSAATRDWIDEHVSFVSTSVDRITPRTTDADRADIEALCGWRDRSPVITEPFRDWVLEGAFPAGRPGWENAGARFVNDIEPYERRKLWLLNGAHSILASAGPLLGHRWVADAIADDTCRGWVEEFWNEAARHLAADLDVPAYRAALIERFANPRIAHDLRQIATDAATKITARLVPVAEAELAAGRDAAAAARGIAAWIAAVLEGGSSPDSREREIAEATGAGSGDGIRRLLALLSPRLADAAAFSALVAGVVVEYRSLNRAPSV